MRNRTVLALAWGTLLVSVVGVLAQTGASTFSSEVQPIFDRECVKCHGQKEKKANLNLSAGESYKALVNVPSKEVPDTVRVKPGDASSSYLWLKISHTSPKGDGMPKGLFFSKHLPQKDMDTINAWIAAGAQP